MPGAGTSAEASGDLRHGPAKLALWRADGRNLDRGNSRFREKTFVNTHGSEAEQTDRESRRHASMYNVVVSVLLLMFCFLLIACLACQTDSCLAAVLRVIRFV